MRSGIFLLAVGLLSGPVVAAGAVSGADGSGSAESFFELKIRPVLMNTCYECHGGEKVKSNLTVDDRAALLSGGERGPAIVPGEPDASLLIQAIRREHEDVEMPPDDPLPQRVVEDFEKWVRDGAVWPDHAEDLEAATGRNADWAFEPIRNPEVPEDPTGWAATDIDRFIAARWREKGIEPIEPADRRTLVRRAYFDLVGLPPTPEQVERFVNDDSPGAYDRLIDRLLASPRYGERWGRHWLDQARYADTSGDASDTPVPEARLYRNYVIDAFNNDLPYDEFLTEQIAGDILAREEGGDRWRKRIIATGFIALSRQFNNRAYADRHLMVENTIDTIGKAVLGMSLKCARCHDHKFDPVTAEDYYGLYGYFKSTRYPHAGTEHTPGRTNFVPLTQDEDVFQKFLELDSERFKLTTKLKRNRGSDKIKSRLNEIRKQMPDVPVAWAVIDKPGGTSDARLQKAGNPRKKADPVPRGFIERISDEHPDIPEGRSGRLELARWLTSEENPLTPRVIVNRVWQYHFGRGLVPTSSTFGAQGKPPTHPELLDWLAQRFMADGWSIKALHRRIMRSKTYRLAGRATSAANRSADPTNELYWHYPRRRLEAEPIRDAILAVADNLDLRRPGPHPFPDYRRWKRVRFTQHNPFTKDYDHNHRSIYLMQRRLGTHPFLAMFDGPNPNESTARRRVSTVPLQSLFWMNSPFVRENAAGFADRLLDAASTRTERIELAYRIAYARPPQETERRETRDYLTAYEAELPDGVPDPERRRRAWVSFCRTLIASNEFLYIE